jgi:hypothetical protein
VGGIETSNITISGDLAADVGRWEALAVDALIGTEPHLSDFKRTPKYTTYESFGDAYRRMSSELAVVEEAIQHSQDC